jgi:hypothetical protein
VLPSSGAHFRRGRLSFKGSVSDIASVKFGPLMTTPQRCSVAYFTCTLCWGYPGSSVPAQAQHSLPQRKVFMHEGERLDAKLTIQIFAELRAFLIKRSIYSSVCNQASALVHRSEVALERDVSRLNVAPSTHTFESSTSTIRFTRIISENAQMCGVRSTCAPGLHGVHQPVQATFCAPRATISHANLRLQTYVTRSIPAMASKSGVSAT